MALFPPPSHVCTLAPCSRSAATTPVCPTAAARCNAVLPACAARRHGGVRLKTAGHVRVGTFVTAFTSVGSRHRSDRTTSTLPASAASCRAMRPFALANAKSAPSVCSWAMAATSPSFAARKSSRPFSTMSRSSDCTQPWDDAAERHARHPWCTHRGPEQPHRDVVVATGARKLVRRVPALRIRRPRECVHSAARLTRYLTALTVLTLPPFAASH